MGGNDSFPLLTTSPCSFYTEAVQLCYHIEGCENTGIFEVNIMPIESGYVGKQIGNYHVIKELASGSSGSVYLARHVFLKKKHPVVAIKVLHAAHLGSQKERDNFLQEAQFLEVLEHPHILSIIDFGIYEGFPYLVAEYAPNGSLRDRLLRPSPKPVPTEEVITILSQIGQALQYAHEQNIVHRDLKPENILFNVKNEALIADFGIATVLGKTKHVDVTGTPFYMAPEQFQGEISKKSDQYALGCMAYELFTGRRPFTASDVYALMVMHSKENPIAPRQLNPQLPLHIERAILKAMTKERADRYVDVAAFISALHKSLAQWLDEGNAFYRTYQYTEALAAYEQAVQLDPNYALAYNGKGNALWMLWQYDEALATYERAIQLDPNNAIFHYNRGAALHYFKQYKEALAAYERAVQLDPYYAPAYNAKGEAFNSLERYKEALAAYERAIQLDPSNITYQNNKDNVLKRLPIASISDQPTIPIPPPAKPRTVSLSVVSISDQPTIPMPPKGQIESERTVPYPVRHLRGRNLNLIVGTRIDPGIKRKHKPNEDSLFAVKGELAYKSEPLPFGLFVVADGMGGHANGQDASRLAIQTIVDAVLPPLSEADQLNDDALLNLLIEGVQHANQAVYQHNQETRTDMGTTMTASLMVGSTAYIANVGDSRTYLYREPDGLKKVTNDHSVVASLVEAGIIKPDDIYTHPKRNQIYRSLGEKPTVEVDGFKVSLQMGDKLLLCSDGLWDMVRDPTIEQILKTPIPDPGQTGNALIKAALEGGGEDNVSVIVVHVTQATRHTGSTDFNIELIAKPDTVTVPMPKKR
jgi:serine/threonine protein phosphatase PrpC/tRNA A-37 threonylcarbamoyl transferase component Bud32/regulator of sirC expression with transglutaminase-like and TPR domain